MEEDAVLYELSYSDTYFKHIKKHKKAKQVKILKRIAELLEDIAQEPTRGVGNPEALRHYGESDVWSRRIDAKHRLMYEIFEEEKRIEILSAYGHYKDKD